MARIITVLFMIVIVIVIVGTFVQYVRVTRSVGEENLAEQVCVKLCIVQNEILNDAEELDNCMNLCYKSY